MIRTIEGQMGPCIIGDGRNLTLDAGADQGSFVMENVIVSDWDINISTGYGDMKSATVHITLQNGGRCWFSKASIPRQIETYSVTDMLHMINAKLQERAE